MSIKPDRVALRPKRFPVERVKIDFRKLLTSMGQALTHATFAYFSPDPGTAASSGVNAGASIFGAVEAFEADAPLEVRAWYLVRGALANALGQLLGELHVRQGPFEGDLEHLDNRFDLILNSDGAEIDRNFLDNPRTLGLLPEIGRVLERWLAAKVGLSAGDARSLALRLDTYLVPALRDESRAHRDYYRLLYEHFEDRFAYAAQMEWDWERNRLELIRQIDLPVFEETFSLRQIYVPLRAYYLEEIEASELAGEGRRRHCVLVMVEEEIIGWLNDASKERDDIRLITGGPGSGKSTFAKWLAAQLSDKRRMRVLFFPLQRFRVEKRLDEAIARYLTTTGRFQQSPVAQDGFASPADPLLMIFDGLDELTKPGDLADEQTRTFIEELRHNLGLWNDGGVRVLALITGRTVYAQAKRPLLRIADRQEIAVLPYLVDADRKKELCGRHEVADESILEDDQREQWWEKYSRAKGLAKALLPGIFKTNHDLRELTADPLLNYLVVLSGFRSDLGGGAEVNRNRIYARLLKDVLDRRHAKRSKTDRTALAAVEEARNQDDFEKLLETIALAAWYGDGRTTSRGEIEKLLPPNLKSAWQDLVTGGPGFTRLIAAFYLRQAEDSVETDAVEFTHKSFGEYLTARRLVREIERISKGRHLSADYYSEQKALEEWARLASARAISMDVLRFLVDEVALRTKDQVQAWQKELSILFDFQLRYGFPLAALGADSFREAEQRARNAEECLLAALHACGSVGESPCQIDWGGYTDLYFNEHLETHVSHAAGAMIHRLRRQRFVVDPIVTLSVLGSLDLSRQNLMVQDRFDSDLRKCTLQRSVLYKTDLRRAKLHKADLREAELTEADLAWADLSEANLDGATLSQADLRDANLSAATLGDADLSDANLSGATLSGANLSGSNLSDADLRGAYLGEAVNVSEDQILSARHFTGAKLPDHLKHLER